MKPDLDKEESYKLLASISDDILGKLSQLLNDNASNYADSGLSSNLISGAQYASMLVILKIYEEVLPPDMIEAAKRAGNILYQLIVHNDKGTAELPLTTKPFEPSKAN